MFNDWEKRMLKGKPLRSLTLAATLITAWIVLLACSSEIADPDAVYAQGNVPWKTEGGPATVKDGVNYLSDLEIAYGINGWGPIERDASNGEAAGGDGRPLTIGGKTYEKGLGMHPSEGEVTWASVHYTLGGKCSSFSAEVGLDDEIDKQVRYGSVYFQVFADGKKLWQSQRLTGNNKAVPTGTLNIAGAQRIKLVVTNAGDNNWYDHADWGDAKVSCGDAQPDPAPNPDPFPVTVGYQADNSDFMNPERGFHDNIEIIEGTDFSYVKNKGYTLARAYIRLDDYRNKPLDEKFLSQLRRGLSAVRDAGIKIIPRFAYNFPRGDYQGAPEAPIDLALEHIRQLAPIYREYSDVIAVHPAGFVGAWGEWHSSSDETNLDSPENKTKILNALLTALPKNLMIQLRYPGDLLNNYPQALSAGQAFEGGNQARVGHHNDCFLANESDAGTYNPAERADAFKRYLDQVTKFTAVGGETCQVTVARARTDCDTAVSEMARFRWDYLNISFYGPAIDRFKREGCFDEISKRLGYRYRLTQTKASAKDIAKGQTLNLELTMRNDGFGKLYNPRPTQVVFVQRNGSGRHVVTLDNDSRKLLPAPGQSKTVPVSAQLPSNLSSGTYDLYLNMPDGRDNLRSRPEYSIRLANQGLWRADSGLNALNVSVQIR